MPPRRQPPRLWERRERRDAAGKLISRAQLLILDGGKQIPTGFGTSQAEDAARALADYIAKEYRPDRRQRDIEHIDIADVLLVYNDDCRDRQANKRTFDERMIRLTEWWGGKMLSEVSGYTCRAYVAHRQAQERKRGRTVGLGGARRDLEDLRAAIGHHAREGLHRAVVNVTLPPKGQARERWLSRSEAARLLWTCWRYRELQRRDRKDKSAAQLPTAKYPLRHLARFILIGLYTGSRAATVAAASPVRSEGHSWVDLERGVFHRRQVGKRETSKRQPPVPIPPQLLAHMRRWHKRGHIASHFVEWHGKPVSSVKTAFASAVDKAGLSDDVTPHTLRHTAATWLMQNGAPMWEASGYLGMSVETLQRTYGHHHPDHMKGALAGFRPRKSDVPLVESLEVHRDRIAK